MTPVKFKGYNKEVGKGQPEYQVLPARVDGDFTTSVWELSDEEIEIIRKTRKLQVSQMNFGKALQPIMLKVFQEHDQY